MPTEEDELQRLRRDAARQLEDGKFDTVVLAAFDALGRLFGKRLTASAFAGSRGRGFAACSTNLTWGADRVPVEAIDLSGAHNGYPNLVLVPCLNRVFPLTHHSSTALVLCDVVTDTDTAIEAAPRHVLAQQIRALAARGLRAQVAVELEFVLYRGVDWRTGPILGSPANYSILAGSAVEPLLKPVRRHVKDAGIELEAIVPEGGRGQIECSFASGEPAEVADQTAVVKQIIKEVANAHGFSASFMAKPFDDDAGNSGHVHLSLWRGGDNIFRSREQTLSAEAAHTLAGLLTVAPAAMLFYAPNANSYKRLQPRSFAPVRANWGFDNRTVAVRALPGEGASARLELRIPGADASPHLTIAAALASARLGLDRQPTPPPPIKGDGSAPDAPGDALPTHLQATAERALASAELVRLFGEPVVAHYLALAQAEAAAAATTVNDWERERYWDAV